MHDLEDAENKPRLVGEVVVHERVKLNMLLSGCWGEEKAELKESSDSDRLRLRTIVSSLMLFVHGYGLRFASL